MCYTYKVTGVNVSNVVINIWKGLVLDYVILLSIQLHVKTASHAVDFPVITNIRIVEYLVYLYDTPCNEKR